MTQVREAKSLALMVMAVWVVVRLLALRLLEEESALGVEAPVRWPACEHCERRRRSKGFRERRLGTLYGPIRWRRRVGRCPQGCAGSVVAPLDEALRVLPHPRTGAEVQWMGGLLVVLVLYEMACRLLQHLTGVRLQAGTLWTWVQSVGQHVMAQVANELQELAAGTLPAAEPLAAEWAARPLVMGADGVMAPFRPEPGTPKGKTRWREVKVAILARLGERLTRHGKRVTHLGQRRVVAVLGKIEDLRPRLWLEAVRQQVRTAGRVVWLSDGGRGFWAVFQRCFQGLGATAILDFYHAAQNLYKGAAAWLAGGSVFGRGTHFPTSACR